ncbi:MAG: hypothetical protein CMA65_04930 [Euryarchaeota archaeon]|nr:hypothetical protein [Euryarchaeota archaeon]
MTASPSSAQRVIFVTFLFLFPLLCATYPINQQDSEESQSVVHNTQARAQVTWSGTQVLSTTYTVSVSDELVIQACTVVQMGGGVRIVVDGRLTVLGTQSCPVTLEASGLSDHEGIQFNSSSSGRGSIIQNLTIEDSIYGMTIYGSNPVIENLTVVNPDRVGVDMFNNAGPRITDLFIDQAGRSLPFQGDWRYGIGLSIGAGSTPIINRAVFSDILTRAVNIWGGSGGLIQGITVDNCSGSSWAMVAGIWVEDSQPLLTDISVDKSDSGMVIRHIDDGGYTRAVVRDATITNSMYRGVYVDKNNHTNYTNYETADFTNLTVRGTGTSGATTANIGYAALEVNATGAWFDNTLIEDSTTVGVRLYFVDDTTTFRNLTIRDSGDPGQGPHEAGLAVRSSFFAPHFEGIDISGSVGPGISSTSGGAMQGFDWTLHNNTKQGLLINRATVVVNDLNLYDNLQSGAHVLDSRYVHFENVTAINNGGDASTNALAKNQAGLYYEESNDLESESGDVRCRNCVVSGSTGSGIFAENSVDLWLENISLSNNSVTAPALLIDNQDTMPSGATGRVNILNAVINTESPSQPAAQFLRTAAHIDGMSFSGNHTGLDWNGDNNGNFASSISNSAFSGTACLKLIDHPSLGGQGNTISASCTGYVQLTNSQVNWSGLGDVSGATVIQLDSASDLHLHQPSNIDLNSASILGSATVDVAWDLTVWVVNNFTNGIPSASVDTTFSNFEPTVQEYTNDLGYVFLPDFIGQRWTSTGPSSSNSVTIQCAYDSVTNSSSTVLDQNRFVNCLLPLDNQAPFLIWATPEDASIYPSNSEVVFDANESWDLDDDELTFSWTSSIDGNILSSCTGSGNPLWDLSDGVAFTVNSNDVWGCTLSDGIHLITLELCDETGQCVSQSRTIELVNLPPVLVVDFEPSLNPWSELIMPQTGTVNISTNGTYDPEGEPVACTIEFVGYIISDIGWDGTYNCPNTLTYTFDHTTESPPALFELRVKVWDEIGNNATRSVDVILYNELPEPVFEIQRQGNESQELVTLDGTSTTDPEGDEMTVTFSSSLDGTLAELTNGSTSWSGYLSRGVHTITMQVTDDRAEHVNQSRTSSALVTVDNSLPLAVIESPSLTTFDSSELIEFSANGSGDFDAACDTFPMDGTWHCAPFSPHGGSEFLVVTWTSDLDGRLTPEGEDWLIFESRLSPGTHLVTLYLDDGIHEPVTATVGLEVVASAPVLGLVSPVDGSSHPSSAVLMLDASESTDYDNDSFVMTLRTSLEDDPLLVDVSPLVSHQLNLRAGYHVLTVTLKDETGMSRDETFTLTINESGPTLRLISPENRQSILPGGSVLLEEASFDADNDLVTREWRLWSADKSFPEIVSTSSIEELTGLSPGEYHLSLYIEDSQGNWEEEHVNITIQSSLPSFVRESLFLSDTTFPAGELSELNISIQLEDADGTTKDVRANLTHNIQQWEINLTDTDGDGVWEGVLKWRPEETGRPSLKIIARDGEGQSANVDIVTRTLTVEEIEQDQRVFFMVVGTTASFGIIGLLAFMISRRRRAIAEIDLIASWDAFRAPEQRPTEDKTPLEGNIMDGTEEVQSELDESM